MTGQEQDRVRLINWWQRTIALTPSEAEIRAMMDAYNRVHNHDWELVAERLKDRLGLGR